MELFFLMYVTILFPPDLLGAFFLVPPHEEIVMLRFGKYIRTIRKPGINWIHPLGREL
jgi:regulator of protease activity HflC (stomatin/prohibitin superfamily)